MFGETIAAIATPLGEGGIGIVRISGADAMNILSKIFSPYTIKWEERRLKLGWVINGQGERLDQVLAVFMGGPRSYTGEDVVEIHCHGGIAALTSILDLVLDCGAQLAEPGEFTKRAFLNGRIDLAQAEAVQDIIIAKSGAALRAASVQLAGVLSYEIKEIREKIIQWIVALEAEIDFPEDVLPVDGDAFLEDAGEMMRKLGVLLSSWKGSGALKEGLRVVIVGRPNVGKSSLWNRLVTGREALVSSVPGTTRDANEEIVNLKGFPIRLIDTAGLHGEPDEVERLGIEMALKQVERADGVIVVLDGSIGLNEQDQVILDKVVNIPGVIVINKADKEQLIRMEELSGYGKETAVISTREGKGLEYVQGFLERFAQKHGAGVMDGAIISQARHATSLQEALVNLTDATEAFNMGYGHDAVLVGLRACWAELGGITGDTVDDEIIDRIFNDFCLGK